MAMDRRLLVISHASDVHADALTWALATLGIESTLLSIEDFPVRDRLSYIHEPNGRWCGIGDEAIGVDQGLVIWRRRVSPHALSPALHPADVAAAELEVKEFIGSLLFSLSEPAHHWINSNEGALRARSKILQLECARRAGLHTPRTIVSNDPEKIRSFCDAVGGRVVSKGFLPRIWTTQKKQKVWIASTTLIRKEMLDAASLETCPSIYQEHVQKAFELRITIFGNEIHAVKIDSQARREILDWRYETDAGKNWPMTEYTLPAPIGERLLRLMAHLGIVMGCVDMIVRPNGEHVFLEVNEQGQFLWVEQDLPSTKLLSRFCRYLVGLLGVDVPSDSLDAVAFSEYMKSQRFQACVKRIESKEKEAHQLASAE